jgi:hypothetical protein
MSTTQQRLAQLIAQRQATAMSVDKTRSYIQNFAKSRINDLKSEIQRSPRNWVGKSGAQSEIQRFASIESAVQRGELPTWSSLAPAATRERYFAPVVFDKSVGFVAKMPDGKELHPRYFQGGKGYQEALLAQNKQFYNSIVAKAGSISALDQEISSLQTQLANELAGGAATGGGSPTSGGGTTITPIEGPVDQIDESSFAQTEAQSNERSRLRRDRARIAFGTPRFGVGINIPLGT